MTKELQERIEKLKNKQFARPFYMLTLEERKILKKAGEDNCLTSGFRRYPKYVDVHHDITGWNEDIYILKPDYSPGPEYTNIAVVVDAHGLLELEEPLDTGMSKNLPWIVAHKDFLMFVSEDLSSARIGDAVTWKREKRKVIARFAKQPHG